MSVTDGKKFKNVSQSGIVHSGKGSIAGVIVNNHTSGTIKVVDGTEDGVSASSTLTSSGAVTVAQHATNRLTSTGAMVAGSHATSVFTSSGVVVDGQTITIGTTVYRAKAVPVQAYDVAMGANAEAFLLNLKAVINGTYTPVQGYTGTPAHSQVVATLSDATTITVWGRVAGTSLNTVATTETFTNGSWADTTLGGGTGASDAGVTVGGATVTIGAQTYTAVVELSETLGATAVPYEVLYGGSVAIFLDNLKLAVNGTGTAGTTYGTGTVVHPDVVATTNSDTVQIFWSRTVGDDTETTRLNAIVTTETLANATWADATLGGGTGNSNPAVTTSASQFAINGRTYTAVIELSESLGASAVADEILWVTSEAVFLDNVKKAINASGIAGTDYSTGTTQNIYVEATTNADTTQLIVARSSGSAGNAITTTENMGNYAWTGLTLASGTGATGRVIADTITLIATASITVVDRFIRLGNAEFNTGLYITVGGTANLTVVYDHQ